MQATRYYSYTKKTSIFTTYFRQMPNLINFWCGSPVVPCGQTDRQDESNNSFSQISVKWLKLEPPLFTHTHTHTRRCVTRRDVTYWPVIHFTYVGIWLWTVKNDRQSPYGSRYSTKPFLWVVAYRTYDVRRTAVCLNLYATVDPLRSLTYATNPLPKIYLNLRTLQHTLVLENLKPEYSPT
jgi:hypothetical protein